MTGEAAGVDGAVSALTEALYDFAENPERAPDIFAAVERLSNHGPIGEPTVALILAHADRVARISARIRDEGHRPADCLLLSSDGLVLGLTGDVERRLEPFLNNSIAIGSGVDWIESAEGEFSGAFDLASLKKARGLFPLVLSNADSGERCSGFLITRDAVPNDIAASATRGNRNFHVALILAAHRGPTLGTELLKQSHALTNAEWSLAQALQRGLTLSEAANELSITLSTARSELKAIFAKLRVHRQAELVTLLNETAQLGGLDRSATAPLTGDPGRRFLTLDDKRVLAYRDYGPPGAVPLISFHATMSASLAPKFLVRLAREAGVRIIAFDRAGFGHSTPTSRYDFTSTAYDVKSLVDHLQLSKVILEGTGTGAAFAIAAARHLGSRAAGVLLECPRLSKFELPPSATPIQKAHAAVLKQRWFHQAVGALFHFGRHRAMAMAYVKNTDGAEGLNSRKGSALFTEEQIARGIDAFEKSGRGMSDELTLFSTSAGESPAQLTCPISVWHGAQNDWMPTSEVLRRFDSHPTTELHVLEDCGTFLPESIYRAMMAWVAATWRAAAIDRSAQTYYAVGEGTRKA